MRNSNDTSSRVKSQPRNSSDIHESRERYEEYLIRSNAEGNRFTFRRDFVISGLMTKYEALFFQDLVNRAGMKKTKKDEDGYFLCTVAFLLKSLCWEPHAQASLLKALKKKGFLDFKNKGLPKRRWVKLHIGEVEEALDQREDKKGPTPSKNTKSQSCVNPHDCSCVDTRTKKKSITYSSNKEKKHSRTQACERVRSAQFLNEENQHTTFGGRLAKLLITRLSEENKIFRKITPQTRPAWARQLNLLASEVEGGETFVEEIIHDHLNNLQDRFQPECYSAAKIRRRFDELVHARKRRNGDKEVPAPEFTERRYQTEDGRTIIECTRVKGGAR